MGRFVKGDVVVLPFPFSNLSNYKNRPCLIIADLSGRDLVLCQITSQSRNDVDAITLKKTDFQKGNLNIDSWIRPSKLFTVEDLVIK